MRATFKGFGQLGKRTFLGLFAISLVFGQVAAVVSPAKADPLYTEQLYNLGGYGDNMAVGADGALWITKYGARTIARMTTEGVITGEYHVPSNNHPRDITAGPDGALWFTIQGNDPTGRIGRITTSGVVTEYTVGYNSGTNFITAGPDGALWFTDQAASSIGRITTNGTVTQFPIPGLGPSEGGLMEIAVGPDGALWFAEYSVNKIGRITTGGQITQFTIPTPNSYPYSLIGGSDGGVWFGEAIGNKVGRITSDGSISEYPVPTTHGSSPNPNRFALGPDGAVWFIEENNQLIARITPTGTITEYPISSTSPYGMIGLTLGPDNAWWYIRYTQIGRVNIPMDFTAPSVTGSPDRSPDVGDWYNHNTTIDWQATDPAPSSGTPTDPPNTVADQEGIVTYASTPSCDPAGNCATGSLQLKLDKTAPTLGTPTWSADPQVYGSNSTLAVPVSDTTSGMSNGEYFIGSDPGAGNGTTMTLSGGNLSATLGASLSVGTHTIGVRARDTAGNWTAVTSTTLTIQDVTPPIITYSLSQMPGLGGWHNSPVVLTWTVSDPESTIDSQAGCNSATVSTDSISPTGTTFTCTATSVGGSSSQSATIKYDASAPVAGTPLWSINPLTIGNNTALTVPVMETLSGVISGEYFVDTDPGLGNGTPMTWSGTADNLSASFGASLQPGVYAVGVRAKDVAGNWGAVVYDYLVVYNPAGPTDVTGKKTLVPSLNDGDVLPGLTSPTQTDQADFAFDLFYTTSGTIDPASAFSFCYDLSNHKCKKPQNNPFSLTATNFSLFSISGTSSANAVFQANATMTANGASSTALIRVEITDGDRLTPVAPDHFTLKVYPAGSDPNITTPTYRVSTDVAGSNNLKIQ